MWWLIFKSRTRRSGAWNGHGASGSQSQALDFSGRRQLLKHAGGIGIIFARLVDDTNEVVCFSIRVMQNGVKFANLNRSSIACVPKANGEALFFSRLAGMMSLGVASF